MLYNPKILINNLNFKFQIFISPNFCFINVIFINSNMFKIAKVSYRIQLKKNLRLLIIKIVFQVNCMI